MNLQEKVDIYTACKSKSTYDCGKCPLNEWIFECGRFVRDICGVFSDLDDEDG